MPLPLTVSCFSKIQIGFTFLVPAHLGSPGQRAFKWVCVCVSFFIPVRSFFINFCSLVVFWHLICTYILLMLCCPSFVTSLLLICHVEMSCLRNCSLQFLFSLFMPFQLVAGKCLLQQLCETESAGSPWVLFFHSFREENLCGKGFLSARCLSCLPTINIKALKKTWMSQWLGFIFSLSIWKWTLIEG